MKFEDKFDALPEIEQTMFVASFIAMITSFITFMPIIIGIATQGIFFPVLFSSTIFILTRVVAEPAVGDLGDWLIQFGFALPFLTYGSVWWGILEDEDDMKSCFFNRNGFNWFIFNMWLTMKSDYIEIKTTDITKFEGFQLVNIEENRDGFRMYARIRNENEHAMLILLQD